MTQVQPVFVDGPLKGTSHPMPSSCIRQGVFLYRESSDELFASFREFTYRVRQVGIWGRVIAYWSCAAGDADPSDLFGVLISPAARAAVIATAPSA